MADIETQILSELNQCRKSPKDYAAKLQSTLKYYKGKIYEKPGSTSIETEEGKTNVQECIKYLKESKPRPELKFSPILEKAAQEHVNDIGSKGLMGHIGSDSSGPNDRVERFGTLQGSFGEIIDYGNSNAEDVIISLLVDDGNLNRVNRLNIMNPDHLYVGIAFGKHEDMQFLSVIVLAQNIEPKSAKSPKASKNETELKPKSSILRPKSRESTIKKFDPNIYVGPGFTIDDIIEVKEAFDVFDSDKSGTIDASELRSIMEEFGLDANNAAIFQMISELDTDSSGKIDFDEFLHLIGGVVTDENSMKEIRKVFNIFDTEKTGLITLRSLKQITKELGEVLSDESLQRLISKGDSNNDGMVSFEDFYYIMTKTIL